MIATIISPVHIPALKILPIASQLDKVMASVNKRNDTFRKLNFFIINVLRFFVGCFTRALALRIIYTNALPKINLHKTAPLIIERTLYF